MEKEIIRVIENDYDYGVDLPLLVKNITEYSKVSKPRRQNIIDKSCEVYLNKHRILTLERHWLPGQELSELHWLFDSRKIKDNPVEDCLKLFELYCTDSLQFLLGDYYVLHLMQSPWNHRTIIDSLHDFMESFNLFYQAQVELRFLLPRIKHLEEKWKEYQKDQEFSFALFD